MYRVESDAITLTLTRRREAFREAFRLARVNGHAALYDAFDIEAPTYFDLVGGDVKICLCSAEARLLRAIFNDNHPVACERRLG